MQLYNSLTRKKETFIPFKEKEVKLYVCGITPYDTTHLGHAFTYIVFDVLVRYLRFKGYNVTYTQNVTDIDDDILKRAKEEKRDWVELGHFWTEKFLSDMNSLNIIPPTHYVKATDSISSMVQIIELLLSKGFAYEKNGTVYFDRAKFSDYGKLSRLNEHQMKLLLKERGGNPNDPIKKHPLDFILWQKSKDDELFWESPWGKGRPGWHIECSAMVKDYLGDQIDIHGGGRDLIYPHHESEIAQSEIYSGKEPFAKYWIHTAMVMYEGEKMSKSLGNLVMVSDLLKKYPGDVIRWVLLSHHYRTPWEFSEEELEEAQAALIQVKRAANQITTKQETIRANDRFILRMDDDFDTPGALDEIRKAAEKNEYLLHQYLSILGFTV